MDATEPGLRKPIVCSQVPGTGTEKKEMETEKARLKWTEKHARSQGLRPYVQGSDSPRSAACVWAPPPGV